MVQGNPTSKYIYIYKRISSYALVWLAWFMIRSTRVIYTFYQTPQQLGLRTKRAANRTQPRLVGLRGGKCSFNSTTQNQKILHTSLFLFHCCANVGSCLTINTSSQPAFPLPCWHTIQTKQSKKPSTLQLLPFPHFSYLPLIFQKKSPLKNIRVPTWNTPINPIKLSIPYLHQLFGSTQLSATLQLGPCFRTLEYHRAGGHQ